MRVIGDLFGIGGLGVGFGNVKAQQQMMSAAAQQQLAMARLAQAGPDQLGQFSVAGGSRASLGCSGTSGLTGLSRYNSALAQQNAYPRRREIAHIEMPWWCTDEAAFRRGIDWANDRREFKWPDGMTAAQSNDFRAGFVRCRYLLDPEPEGETPYYGNPLA